MPLSEQEIIIRQERQQLLDLGIDPYPAKIFRVNQSTTQIVERFNKGEDLNEVVIAGRLMSKRIMGSASFAELQDASGRIQLYLKRDDLCPDEDKTLYNTVFKNVLGIGDIIGVTGNVFKTQSGEITVNAKTLVVLSKSLRPLPIVKETTDEQGNKILHDAFSDPEQRYRQRYVDLIVNEESRQVFKTRSAIVAYIRAFLDAQDYLEVETPMMQSMPVGAIARPFTTHHNALDMSLYLRVAPELNLKRLIVGGFERVYEINRNFRNEGVSTQHNPEFTMLELYRAYADYEDLIDMVEALMHGMADAILGLPKLTYQGEEFDLSAAFDRVTVEEVILKFNPDIDASKLRDRDYLVGICEKLDIRVEEGYGPGKLQLEIFEKTGEDSLRNPTFVTHYPTEVSPLSRRNDEDPFVTDRFEFFVAGREIANGFSELNDPEDQADRFRAQVANRDAGDDEAMAYDHDYIRALEYGMPPTAGIGVGIDRLVMLFTDSASIRDVLLFPHMRPEVFD